jgi:integrase
MRTVQNRPTKESRRAERQKVGSLSSLVVQPKTKNRYAESFRKFCEFHELVESFPLPEFHIFDEWVADYVEQLWEEGSPKSDASYALAAIQFFRPQAKNHLVWSWKLVKTWNQVELPTRATPFSAELVLSMAGQAFKWKQFRMGWLLILGFAAFLRTSELITIERKEVVLPQHGRPQEAVLLLSDTKGTKKNLLPLDKVVIQEKLCLQALQQLCKGLQPGDSLSQQSNRQFRKLFKDLLHALQLGNQGYMPYSLRRGGVTSAYKLGVPLDVLVTQGRWQHLPTARLYIDHGLQSLAQISHPPQTLHLCAKMRQWFRTVSQDGTRGMRLGKCQSWMADTS